MVRIHCCQEVGNQQLCLLGDKLLALSFFHKGQGGWLAVSLCLSSFPERRGLLRSPGLLAPHMLWGFEGAVKRNTDQRQKDEQLLFGKADVYPCSDFGTPKLSLSRSFFALCRFALRVRLASLSLPDRLALTRNMQTCRCFGCRHDISRAIQAREIRTRREKNGTTLDQSPVE